MVKDTQSQAGRPTVLTPKVVSQLEALLSCGLTVREACLESEISHEAYYNKARTDQQFADKMTKAQNTVTTTAKKVVATKVLGGDTKTAMWWLDRLDKKEQAKVQGVAEGSQPPDTEAGLETESQSTEDMIEIYEGYEQLIALKYKEVLISRIYDLPESERYEANNQLYALNYRELYEQATAEYGHSSWYRDKPRSDTQQPS